MLTTKTMATFAAASLALAGLLASDLSAAAQSSGLTNGPNGNQPNGLASKMPNSSNGKSPSRAMMTKKRPARMMHRSSYQGSRPLTVRRYAEAPVVAAPAPAVNTGPGTIVTAPLGFGSNVVSLPFRGLNAIFPAGGDFASNPLVLIGAPIHAIGDIAQLPFRIIGTPFGGTTIATY